MTPEDPSYPIESALLAGQGSGWRAAGPGRQTIHIIFTHPQQLREIWLNFHEPDVNARKSMSCVGSRIAESPFKKSYANSGTLVPHGSTRETEDHHVGLLAVTVLELSIIPDISWGNAFSPLEPGGLILTEQSRCEDVADGFLCSFTKRVDQLFSKYLWQGIPTRGLCTSSTHRGMRQHPVFQGWRMGEPCHLENLLLVQSFSS